MFTCLCDKFIAVMCSHVYAYLSGYRLVGLVVKDYHLVGLVVKDYRLVGLVVKDYHLVGLVVKDYHLVGIVVKASASRAADQGSVPAFSVRIFSGWSHPRDLQIGTPVATLPGAWRYRVSAGTGWPGVSVL